MTNPLNTAIDAAGGVKAFAVAVGAPSADAVKAWKRGRVPSDYCPTIERITGVRCEELRPDVEWAVLRSTTPTEQATQ